MRVIQLTKRQYTGKDLLDDRYGRLYELPVAMAKGGATVFGICLSYRKRASGWLEAGGNNKGSVSWYSHNLFQFGLPNILGYLRVVESLARPLKPDLVFSSSDSLHIILGAWLAKKMNIPHVADLYDNYESFGIADIPGVLPYFKQALCNAQGVVCVTEELANYVVQNYLPQGKFVVVGNAIPRDMFGPISRQVCRAKLGLAEDAVFIGTGGALHRSRGIEAFYKAFDGLVAADERIHMLLAGPIDRAMPPPKHDNVHYLGELSYAEMPVFINALDVAVICNRDSAFGRYCFPQKAYEILACQVPLVAARVGVMKSLLADYEECLFDAENVDSMSRAIERQLRLATVPKVSIPTWCDQAEKLKEFFERVTKKSRLSN